MWHFLISFPVLRTGPHSLMHVKIEDDGYSSYVLCAPTNMEDPTRNKTPSRSVFQANEALADMYALTELWGALHTVVVLLHRACDSAVRRSQHH